VATTRTATCWPSSGSGTGSRPWSWPTRPASSSPASPPP